MKESQHNAHGGHSTSGVALAGLALAALGVVFGDIGTSVLYAMNEIFFGHHAASLTQANEVGAASLAVWALTIVVTFKYVTYVLRADNDKEGGVFALLGLLKDNKRRFAMFLTGSLFVLSAGLLFGDGLITPAISVLSAVEGLKVAAPALEQYVIPITVVILIGLFLIQSQGTGKVGKFFGPIVTLWFTVIAVLGLRQIIHTPGILVAFNPWYGISFLREIGFGESLFVLGSIMLVVTGGEALFADMGHFGKKPIRLAWFVAVYPALMLNYLGQGAYMLSGQTVEGNNIFYSMVPHAILFPMIILATMATVIASQALISGVFSLVAQGVSLGLFPRISIVHTHEEHEGQIYVPFINWALLIGCIMLVIGFRSSTALASAYGLAVAGDMLITSLAMILISKDLWHWNWFRAIAVFGVLGVIDLSFLTANSVKFFEGGFVPLGIGLVMYTIMKSWQWGRIAVAKAYEERTQMKMSDIVALNKQSTNYFPRSVLLLSSTYPTKPEDSVPGLFQLFWGRYGLMPKHLVLLSISAEKVPYVHGDRYEVSVFENDGEHGTIASIKAKYGFMETMEVSDILKYINEHPDLIANEDLRNWIIFVGRERIIPLEGSKVRNKIKYYVYRILQRNAIPAYEYYGIGEDLRLATALVPIKI